MADKATQGRLILPETTAAQLKASNPILKARQLHYECDTGKAKVGDGVSHWNDLAYVGERKIAAFTLAGVVNAQWGTAMELKAEPYSAPFFVLGSNRSIVLPKGLYQGFLDGYIVTAESVTEDWLKNTWITLSGCAVDSNNSITRTEKDSSGIATIYFTGNKIFSSDPAAGEDAITIDIIQDNTVAYDIESSTTGPILVIEKLA